MALFNTMETANKVHAIAANITSPITIIPDELKVSLRDELSASFKILMEKQVADMESFYKNELN